MVLVVERQGQRCAADSARALLHERRLVRWANRAGE